ncbi:hypothetical protein EDB80DRAFT_870214 [Ilyonectria destructans]|nr:hypothetical protein EDB80DRAFT_870214 [Ilyonectria destructans]
MSAPKLTHVFNVVVSVSFPTGMGPGNEFSSLTVINGESGYVETVDKSTRLEISSISDWMILGARKTTATVDARLSSNGLGGINLDMHYLGKFTITPGTTKVFSGTPGTGFDFGDEYLYVSPTISSRSEQFGWVNDAVFLAVGKAKCGEGGAGQISYQIFKNDQIT